MDSESALTAGRGARERSHLESGRRERGERRALKAESVSGRANSTVAAEQGSASSFLGIIHHSSGQRVEKLAMRSLTSSRRGEYFRMGLHPCSFSYALVLL